MKNSIIRSKHIKLLFLFAVSINFLGCSKVSELAEEVSLQGLSIVTSALSPGVVGKFYSENVTASGGSSPYSFALTSGSFPSGLSMTATGSITGIPLATSSTSLTFQVTDAKGDVSEQTLALIVSDELLITTSTLDPATVGVAYVQTISVTGGTGVYEYSATGLPSGFIINSVNGIISGSSIASSSSSVVVTVTDSAGLQDSKSFTFSVTAPPVISTTTLPSSVITSAYSETLSVTDGSAPFIWTVLSGSLPAGLSLSSGGIISGTPTAGANLANSPFSFTVQVTDSLGQADSQLLSLAVTTLPRVFDDFRQPLDVARVGVTYSGFIRSEGGLGAITYSASGLPVGLSVNSVSGRVSGTPGPGTAGTYAVTFTATTAGGLSADQVKSLRVVASAVADYSFAAPIQTPLGLYNGNWAYPAQLGFDVADMNNDGHNDVIWGAQDSRGIVVMLGNGTGSFAKTFFVSPASLRPRMVKVSDLNSDGILDVITSTVDSRIEIYIGHASGWVNAPTTLSYNLAYDNYGFDIADMNGDGAPDIVVTNWSNGQIRVLFNCGSSATVNIPAPTACSLSNSPMTLHEVNIGTLGQPRDVVLHDFDNDGDMDVIATSYNGATVGIILGNGNGTFGTIYTIPVGAVGPRGIAKADMNLDGRMDVVITGDNAVSVMLNSAGTPPNNVSLSASSYAINDLGVNSEAIDVGDLNNDTYPDVAFVSAVTGKNSLGIFLNDGSGGLASRLMIDSGYQTFGVRLASITSASVSAGVPDLSVGVGHWDSLSRLLVYQNSQDVSAPIKQGIKYFNTAPSSYAAAFGLAKSADFNEDGYGDIIYKLGGAANMMLGSVTGDMTLSTVSIPTGDISGRTWHGLQNHVADVNSDGHMDFLSANWNNGGLGSITTVLGNGDGTFGAQSTTIIEIAGCLANMGARSLDTGDFNRDGKLDILVGVGCSNPLTPRAFVYYGNGDGSYDDSTREELVGTSNYVYLVAARDVNNDGITDAVVVGNDSVVRQYRNDGSGNFTLFGSADMGMSSNLSMLSVADLDKNGYLDYVVSSQSSAFVGRSMATGTGSISGGTTTTITGSVGDYLNQHQMGSLLVDYDEDGITDLITMRRFLELNPSNRNGGGGLHFYRGTGSGSFTTQTRVLAPAAYGPYCEGFISLMDVNNDGKLDIINTNIHNNTSTDAGIGINYNYSE